MPFPRVLRPLAVLLLLTGCVATDELTPGAEGAAANSGSARPTTRTDARIRTVQLYRTPNETDLPILALGQGQTLTLAFDLLDEAGGRPLSIYFYHLDRTGRRDLTPSEFLRSFLSDDLRNYQLSGATAVRYAHYEYEFPNTTIDFLVSGNYVLRVTEQGDEDAVLFERPFFLSEEAAEVTFAFQRGLGLGGPAVQPVVQLRPGARLQDAQVFDYAVCFGRNGRLDRLRCAADPSLLEMALYQFALPREQAFETGEGLYEVDLGPLQVNPQVVSVDYGTNPYGVTLDLDYARFGEFISDDLLAGQPIVEAAALDVGDPDTEAEYADVLFRFVPEGERPAGPVLVSGSFNNWQADPATELTWNATAGRYEGTLLLKQGRYAYRYIADEATVRGGLGQPSLYTALVYLRDPVRLTDRLVGVRSALAD